MEDPTNLVADANKPRRSTTIAVVVAGTFLVLCVMIALGVVYYVIARPYFGPKSQAILAPDHTLVSRVNPADLEKDAEILNARSKALGTHIAFRVDDKNEIVAEGPASQLTRQSIDGLLAIGLLELVDFGAKPVAEGTQVATDFGYPFFAAVQGAKWHTVLTNAEFEAVFVQSSSVAGQYEIAFTLTPGGRQILSDFTASHINQYLGIVMDKRVVSCPVIKNAITAGQGVIQGGFTRDQAFSLAVNLRVRGPLPIPLEVVSFVDGGK